MQDAGRGGKPSLAGLGIYNLTSIYHEEYYEVAMNMKKAYILAPAGDEDAALAAILAGADAVYLGLPRFNARLKAANITEESLPAIVRLAHAHGVKIYAAVNTLITTAEIGEFLAVVGICLKAGVDALIIQDYGALYLLKRLYPEVKIHASTQITSHNSKQLELLQRFGVRQVNLCREMSLAEIRELTGAADRMGIKSEVFVHGAYCLSFSGQCLMSSFIGGHSANRGLCAQPCRKAYGLRRGGEGKSYRLSLKDNQALKHAASLLEAGVSSLKIEGRLKNFYYVYQTVSAWREQLDRIYAGSPPNRDDQRVHTVFNRGFSTGYLENKICGRMFIDSPLDNSLTLVGEVKRYMADQRLLQLTKGADLSTGVKINIYTPANHFICAATVEEKKAADTFRIRLEHLVRDKILMGQMVFTRRDIDERAMIQARLKHMKADRSPVRVKVIGEEGQRLRATFCSEHGVITVESALALQKATQNPLTPEILSKIFGKLGETSFRLESVDGSGLRGDLFLPVSELNKLRRKAISQWESKDVRPIVPLGQISLPPTLPPQKSSLAVLVSDLEEAAYFSPITRTVLLEISSAEQLQKAAHCLSRYPNTVPFFPAILFEKELRRLAKVLDNTICSRIVADNSGLGLAAAQKGIEWVAGPALNCTNPYAARALQEEGEAQGVFLSPELNSRQIREASTATGGPTWLTVMGPLLLMTTRQCLLQDSAHCQKQECDAQCLSSCRQDAVWYDELDLPFYIYKRPGAHTQVFNNAVLFIPEAVRLLKGRISHFVLDMRNLPFYHLPLDDKRVIMDYFARVLAGEADQDQDKKAMKEMLPKTTTGHFKRGL